MNTRKILLIIFLLFTVIINSHQMEYIENITNYAEYVTELLEYIKTDEIEYEKFNKIIEKIDLEKEIIIEKTIKYPVNVEKLRNYIEENPEHGEYFAEIIEIIKEYTGQHTNNINIKKLNTELVNLSSINSNNNIKNNRDETGQDSLDPEHSDMGTPKISPEKDSKNPLFKPDKFLPDDPTIPYYLWLPKDPNKPNNNEQALPENLHCTVKNTTPEASNDISQSTPTKKVLRYQENKKRDWGWGEYDNLPLGHGHYLADFQIIFEEIEEHNGKLARRYVDRLHNIHTFYYEVDNKWHPARLHFNKMEETDEYIIITEKNGKKLYFTQGRIQFETDNNGNKTTYHYDQDGRLLEKKLPNGLSTKYVWGTNSGNRVVEMIGFDGKTQFKFEYNSTMNIMTDIVLNDGSRIVKGHDEYGRTINVNTRQQNYKTYKYDSKGRIVEFGDGKNDYIRRTYTESGPYTIIIDKSDLGRERKYVYFKSNRIKQIIDYTGAEYNYTYNANGLPTSVSDKYGMEFKLNYDNMGNLISYKNPYGGITYIKYNKFHKPVQVTDPEGNITKYEYDDRGNLIKTINPDGKQSTFTIDEYGRIVSMTDFENNEYEITYDEHWNISSVTDPDGNKIEYTTDMLGRITAIKDRNGKEEKFEYTFEHNLSKYIKKDGNSIDINYTNFGKIKEISDEEQNKTEYHYDYKGDLIKVKDEIGETEIKLDLLNQPVEITDAQGAVTKIKYGTKNLSLPVEVTDAEGRKIKYSYRLDGKIRSIMDEEKRGIFYNYNQAGNISEVYISGKLAYKMEYDKIGRTKSITNGKNEKTEINYTKTGQIKSIIDPEGNTIRYEYDGNGNRIKIIEPEGNITEVKYTDTGLIEAVRKAAGENKNIEETITEYEYNKEGQLTTIKLPDGLRKFVKYNEVDNLVNYIPETGEEIKYDYDKKGNLTKRMLNENNLQQREYNQRNQLIKMITKDKIYQYEYDSVNRVTNVKRESNANETGMNRESNANETGMKRGKTSSNSYNFAYDKTGNLIKQTYPDNKEVIFTYDKSGLLTQTETMRGYQKYIYNGQTQIEKIIRNGKEINFEYDEAFRQTKINYPNGIEKQTEYYKNGKIKREKVTRKNRDRNANESLYSAEYKYNKNGWLIEKTETIEPETKTTPAATIISKYEYDSIGRIIKSIIENKEASLLSQRPQESSVTALITEYFYDKNGNRIRTKNSITGTTDYKYHNNQLLKQINGVETAIGVKRQQDGSGEETITEYIYDKEGSLIQTIGNNNKKYEYDAFNQLKAVNRVTNVNRDRNANETGMKRGKTSRNAFINYEYSPLGWRESKTVKTNEENYTENYYYLGANIFETLKERESNGNETGMKRE